jgi:phosphopantetheinyl transferase
MAIFCGGVPVRWALMLDCDTIIEDWSWVRPLAKKINKIQSRQQTDIYFQRRRSEWLASLAGLWFHKYWNFKSEEIEKKFGMKLDKLKEREKELRDFELSIFNIELPKDLKLFIKELK